MSLIDPISVPQLAARYPRDPGRLRHHLTTEPLLGYAALAEAARALPPSQVERRVHDAGNGEATAAVVPYLAEAGLLDGHRLTLHWEAIDAFKEAYPHLSVTQELFEIDRRRIGRLVGLPRRLGNHDQRRGPALGTQAGDVALEDHQLLLTLAKIRLEAGIVYAQQRLPLFDDISLFDEDLFDDPPFQVLDHLHLARKAGAWRGAPSRAGALHTPVLSG